MTAHFLCWLGSCPRKDLEYPEEELAAEKFVGADVIAIPVKGSAEESIAKETPPAAEETASGQIGQSLADSSLKELGYSEKEFAADKFIVANMGTTPKKGSVDEPVASELPAAAEDKPSGQSRASVRRNRRRRLLQAMELYRTAPEIARQNQRGKVQAMEIHRDNQRRLRLHASAASPVEQTSKLSYRLEASDAQPVGRITPDRAGDDVSKAADAASRSNRQVRIRTSYTPEDNSAPREMTLRNDLKIRYTSRYEMAGVLRDDEMFGREPPIKAPTSNESRAPQQPSSQRVDPPQRKGLCILKHTTQRPPVRTLAVEGRKDRNFRTLREGKVPLPSPSQPRSQSQLKRPVNFRKFVVGEFRVRRRVLENLPPEHETQSELWETLMQEDTGSGESAAPMHADSSSREEGDWLADEVWGVFSVGPRSQGERGGEADEGPAYEPVEEMREW